MNGNNVTLKLVGIASAVAVAAFAVGGWVGDLRASGARRDAELTELRTIARDIRSMLDGMDKRVKSLEDWQRGEMAAPRAPR